MRELNHQQAQYLIQSALVGLISNPDEAALQAHLKDCPECRSYQRQMSALETGLRQAMHARWDSIRVPEVQITERMVKKVRTFAMLKKSLNIAAAGVALVAIVLLVAFAMTLLPRQEAQPGGDVSSGSPAETPEPTPSEAELADAAQYAEQYGLSPEEAVRRLRLQFEVGGLGAALQREQAETFAGLWIEHEPDFRVIAAFTKDGEAAIKPYIEGKPFEDVVEVRTLPHTLRELETAQQEVIRAARELDIPISSYIDVKENKVRVEVGNPELFLEEVRQAGLELPEIVEVAAIDPDRLSDTLRGGVETYLGPEGEMIYFPRQAPTNVYMDALLEGTLILDPDGCLRIAGDSGDPILILWHHNFSLNFVEETIEVLNGDGQVVARVGEPVRMGGGETSASTVPGLPGGVCEGPFWALGDIVKAEIPSELEVPTQPATENQTYTDPAGQYRLSIPSGWASGDEEGTFVGPDGSLRTGYLPEMAFMNSVHRVCERLANLSGKPVHQIQLSPLPAADACLLVPQPEMSTDRVTLVVENPEGEPEQRYFFVETNRGHFEAVYTSLEVLNLPEEREAYPYPTGPMRPEDEAFWAETGEIPVELTVEEYAVSEASEDSPTGFEFRERIPTEVFRKREEWRGGIWEKRLAGNNALLEPFGYSLKTKEGSEMELYELYRGNELILDEINFFRPVSVSASGNDFALVVETMNGGAKLVRKDSLTDHDMSASMSYPPVFYGDELISLYYDYERNQVQVRRGEEPIYGFASQFMVDVPAKGLWSWDGHWLLEVDGFLIQDGENLNESLGYEEIFGWQLLNGKPFYYFRKGPQVGISYDGQVLPVSFEEIIHYRCCEPAMFNNGGNEDMAWFYGLREGKWYYVEVGVYGEG